ncbi:MAG: hypothetical protein IJ386_00320 [Clostridia bacterium]|nr:hypothetical protein [Clostridia bacterium]
MLEHGSDGSALFNRLRFSGEVKRLVTSLLSIDSSPGSRRDVCVLMRKYGEYLPTVAEYLRILCLDGVLPDGLAGAELMAEADGIIRDDVPYLLPHLQVRGGDVIACGIKSNRVGECLEHLLAEVQEGRIPNEKDSLLSAATAKYKTE